MSSGRGDELQSPWVSIPALIPRVEHGTGGDDLAVLASDFFFGAAAGTNATASVTGVAVTVSAGAVAAAGAAQGTTGGAALATAIGTAAATGAASAPVSGAAGVLASGPLVAAGSAIADVTGTPISVTVGSVAAIGDAPPTTDSGSGSGARQLVMTHRDSRRVRRDGSAAVAGVGVVARVGRTSAQGAGAARLDGLPVTLAAGACGAHGIHNLPEALLAWVLEEAA